MQTEFYSNGKLLLTGEYAVLDGAKAWAVPTKFGQHLRITQSPGKNLIWRSLDEHDQTWFECLFKIDGLLIKAASDLDMATRLQSILMEAKKLNPSFLTNDDGLKAETKLTFSKKWGLGSSSTLISNIAFWANVNPYQLLGASFGGSGYDIACARHNTPIMFQLANGEPIIEEILEHSMLKDHIFFVYLNRKQNSRKAIQQYRSQNIDKDALLDKINELTTKMISATSLVEFESLIIQHENILADALKLPTLKSKYFNDYEGAIKSLGGWGGDFFMATGHKKTPDYFKARGFNIVLSYTDMVL
jgi:mevalonate kinase